MAKSGPRELAAYHQQVLAREGRRKVKATEFDTEKLDSETVSTASERVNKVLHPAADEPKSAIQQLAEAGGQTIPAAPTPTAPAPRKRAERSDKGKPKPKPTPGTVVLKQELTIPEAIDAVCQALRNGKTELAHTLVDAIGKAQKTQQA